MHLFFRPHTLSDKKLKSFSAFSGAGLGVLLQVCCLLNSPPELSYLAELLSSALFTLSARGVVFSTDCDISPEQVN